MSGEKNLTRLLQSLSPSLDPQSYVFCCLKDKSYGAFTELNPIASFKEQEGLTLVLTQTSADQASLAYEGVFSRLELSVYSSLQAVGLTAAVAKALAKEQISANVFAAFYHDYIFVSQSDGERALVVLKRLSSS